MPPAKKLRYGILVGFMKKSRLHKESSRLVACGFGAVPALAVRRLRFACFLFACALMCMAFALLFCLADGAQAITEETEAEVTKTQRVLEESSRRYEEIVKKLDELKPVVEENEKELAALQSEVEGRQEAGARSMRFLYVMQQRAPGLIEIILAVDNLGDFLKTYEYLSSIYENHCEELERLADLKDQAKEMQEELSSRQAEVEEQEAEAAQALQKAQEAREAVQEKARAEAEAEAAAAEAERQAALARQQEEKEKQEEAEREAAESSSGGSSGSFAVVSADGANWSSDKKSFVGEWGPRIDAYLSGSPLSGQGETFAAAAWDYGVDPRWSPAISNTESSKGTHCFLPHNAWGWGSCSWDSWEEAINDHVAGLARGYGYTLSVSGAKKYCPPNWENWYRNTLAQMEMI